MTVIDELVEFLQGGAVVDGALEKGWRCEVVKVDEEKRVALSVALKASGGENGDRPDKEGDMVSAEEVEKAAYDFMLNSRFMDLHHREKLSKLRVAVVESSLAPVAFQAGETAVMKGDWLVGLKFFDETLWEKVKKGEINAFSIKGKGRRRRVA